MTTGEIANGRSIDRIDQRLASELLADEHERVITPKIVLRGTAMPTQTIVSQKACSPSELVIASIGALEAMLEGPVEDQADGHDQQRRQVERARRSEGRGGRAAKRAHAWILQRAKQLIASSTPTAIASSSDRHGSGARVVARLHPPEDVDRRRLRLEGDVAREQDQRAELADRPREGERAAGDDRRGEVGQEDAAEDPVVGARRATRPPPPSRGPPPSAPAARRG